MNKLNFKVFVNMKKNLFLVAMAAVVLAACSDNLADSPPVVTPTPEARLIPIEFGSASNGMTRANHVGAEAATMLNYQFVVSGFKDGDTDPIPAATEVFDDFIVNWQENTAGTTESNRADWEYVGITAVAPSDIAGKKQAIKYWDYTKDHYDFIAYSTGTVTAVTTTPDAGGGEVQVTAISGGTTANTLSYTLTGSASDLQECYIADMVTVYKDGTDPKYSYGNVVPLVFRSLSCKARVALYETIPGYSVKDVKFYTDNTTSIASGASETDAYLFTTGDTDDDNFYTYGSCEVSFPNTGRTKYGEGNTDYNKAHVSFTGTTGVTTASFGGLNYSGKESDEKNGTQFLGRTSSTATYAGTASPYYQIMMPNEVGTVLELRIDYTLEAIDGTGEEITVYGAKAFVPAIYATWKPNYAYTYIFKISDKTNGWTSQIDTDPEGLYPITFDAVVVDSEEATQTTITSVDIPSITTYQKGHNPADNEYAAGDIYVMVKDGNGDLKGDLNTKGTTYLISSGVATEAEVMDALNIQDYSSTASNVIGRNGVTLTKFSHNYPTAIPGVDGNDITVTVNTAAQFKARANRYYAYVYEVEDKADTEIHTAVKPASEPADLTTAYYTDKDCTTLATVWDASAYYYQKYNNNNTVYAVKVVKIK